MPVGLYHLYLATALQLCALHYKPGMLTTVKARLKMLEDNGYIQHSIIPTAAFRSPFYYTLGRAGASYLNRAGMDVNGSFRSQKETNKHSMFVQHTLELNDILISAALLKNVAPDYYLDRFMHERELKRKPFKTSYQGEKLVLMPDGFLDFGLNLPGGKQGHLPVLVEHDRGTEQQKHFRQRIRAYIILLKSEAYKELFGVKSITVAFTTFVGKKRLIQMREWTRQELKGESKELAQNFLFTTQTQPLDPCHLWLERCWLMPHEEPPIALLQE